MVTVTCHLSLGMHMQEESWPEIARRQFLLLEVAAMVKALDSSGGLGPAVGAPGGSPFCCRRHDHITTSQLRNSLCNMSSKERRLLGPAASARFVRGALSLPNVQPLHSL
jgi:hypothetical protein